MYGNLYPQDITNSKIMFKLVSEEKNKIVITKLNNIIKTLNDDTSEVNNQSNNEKWYFYKYQLEKLIKQI